MTQSSALSGLTPRKHGEEKEDDLERTARLTTGTLEDLRLSSKTMRIASWICSKKRVREL
jgi:hypothetical protein